MRLSFIHKWFLSIMTAAVMMIPGGLTSGISAETKGSAASLTNVAKTALQKHAQVVQSASKPKTFETNRTKNLAPKYILPGTQGPNALWLNEALAALHYLPLEFTPNAATKPNTPSPTLENNSTPTTNATMVTLTGQLAEGLQNGLLTPLKGEWTWNTSYPSSLTQLWDPATATVITVGAVMSFEHIHGLEVDGVAGADVYAALGNALALNQTNPNPYVYVTVSKTGSERLNVWKGSHVLYTSLANTGISEAPTPNGTWPIYLRLRSQTMQGKTPTGQTYSDPGVPFVNYFDQGCAIHGYPRTSYGSPQSLGCVELPFASAEAVYNLLDYGTLVTVGS